MLLRIVLGVVLGGGIGLAVGYAGKMMGGQCPILCNPYISTGLGVMVGLLLASRSAGASSLMTGEHLVHLQSEEAYRRIVEQPGVALVEFYTEHCPSCVKQAPVISALADRYAGRAKVAVADARKLGGIAAELGIRAVPTTVIYKDGEAAATLQGAKPEDVLAGEIETLLGPAAEDDAKWVEAEFEGDDET